MEIESLMMMPIREVDLVQPGQPMNFTFNRANNMLRWDKSVNLSKESWIVGYNIYIEDRHVKTVYGNQFLMDENISKGTKLTIRALNASGIESEASFFTIK